MATVTINKRKDDAYCVPKECTRVVPTWIVALDNAPTAVMFFLGAVLLWFIWWPLAVVFLVYCGLSIVLFWALICPYCPHWDTRACPCGYGVVAPKFFKFKGSKDFKKVFRNNIAIVFPGWFVPFFGGIYLLWTGFMWQILYIFLLFCVIGFAVIPAISKFVGCRGCEIKNQCPWMT